MSFVRVRLADVQSRGKSAGSVKDIRLCTQAVVLDGSP
jgi:hypothetical protein